MKEGIARIIRRARPAFFGQGDTVYQRVPSKEETQKTESSVKKIAENVYLVKYNTVPHEMLVHHCEGREDYKEMTLRENNDGPMYWCEGCGFVLDKGIAMAVRLYEAPIS
ncbi:hypothetical protein LCGC14_0209460 [marine sediment metagenome]|uniref:Uncharacterized protein n=1 Tax=marine sediment metagenome TaxID=412755 RepID=A0A0F9UGV7_9ZZZZ